MGKFYTDAPIKGPVNLPSGVRIGGPGPDPDKIIEIKEGDSEPLSGEELETLKGWIKDLIDALNADGGFNLPNPGEGSGSQKDYPVPEQVQTVLKIAFETLMIDVRKGLYREGDEALVPDNALTATRHFLDVILPNLRVQVADLIPEEDKPVPQDGPVELE